MVIIFVAFIIEQNIVDEQGNTLISPGAHMFAPGSVTETSLNTLVSTYNIAVTPNTALLFGDFIAGLIAIGGILFSTITGGVFGDTIHAIPFLNAGFGFELLLRAFFTFSSAMLILNILTGRDL